MKKLALAIVGVAAMGGVAFAQGDLSWSAPSSNLIVNTNSAISALYGGPGSGGTFAATPGNDGTTGNTYYYELLYNTSFGGSAIASPTKGQLFGGSWLDTGLEATNGATANGRVAMISPNPQAGVSWAQGTTNNILLVGWSANLGSSWGVVSNELATQSTFAANSFFGVSVTGYLTPNTPPANGAQIFGVGATANGLPIINGGANPMMLYALPTVPEPATLALAGLGGLSLLLFRRQRK